MSIELMTRAWKSSLPATPKMVLLALADGCNDAGETYPGVPRVAGKCSLTERSVQKAMGTLESLGYLSRDYRTGRSTVYRLHILPGGEPGSPPNVVHPSEGKGVNVVHQGGERGSGGGEPRSPRIITYPKGNQGQDKSDPVGPTPAEPVPVKWTKADHELSQQILDRVRDVTTAVKGSASWPDDIRLMRERDGRSLAEILDLFLWAHGDDFWRANILSPGKLRAKWAVLEAQRKRRRPGVVDNRDVAARAAAAIRGEFP